MKRKIEELTKKEVIVTLDALYTAASAVKGREAVKLFLRDLLTPSERIMLGRRIIIARMLIAGEVEKDVSARLRVGRSTVWRVRRWLEDQFPGYENAITKMEQEYLRRKKKGVHGLQPYSAAWVKKHYPLMFWFVPERINARKRGNRDFYPR